MGCHMEAVNIANLSLIALGQQTITALTDENENARRCNAVYETMRDTLMAKHPWNFAIKRATLVNITTPSVDAWVTATAYVVDDVIEYESVFYICLVAHTSDVFSVNLAAGNWVTDTDWVTATQYIVGEQVYHTGISYTCLVAHTSGVFATDLTAVKWIVSVEPGYDFGRAYRFPTNLLRLLSLESDDNHKVEGGYLYTSDTEAQIKYIAQVTDPDEWSPGFVTALAASIAAALSLAITDSRTISSDVKAEAKEKLLSALAVDAQGGGTPEQVKSNEWIDARS